MCVLVLHYKFGLCAAFVNQGNDVEMRPLALQGVHQGKLKPTVKGVCQAGPYPGGFVGFN